MSEDRRAESLLDHVAETALDDDYYVVRAGEPVAERTANTLVVGLVMAAFAALVTVAALQSASEQPSRQLERRTLVEDIDAGRSTLSAQRAELDALQAEVDGLGTRADRADPRVADLRVLAADRSVSGPGLTVTLGDGPSGAESSRVTATDLRVVVNALWYAGAEAIAIGDQRLSARSGIATAQGIVQVNYQPVATPYTISVIGDETTVSDRFRAGGAGRYLQARTEADGLTLDVSPSDDVVLPAAPRGPESLADARAIQEDR